MFLGFCSRCVFLSLTLFTRFYLLRCYLFWCYPTGFCGFSGCWSLLQSLLYSLGQARTPIYPEDWTQLWGSFTGMLTVVGSLTPTVSEAMSSLARCRSLTKTVRGNFSTLSPQLQRQCSPMGKVGRMPSTCSVTPFPISTFKWQKTAILWRKGGVRGGGGTGMPILQPSLLQDCRGLIFAPTFSEWAERA